MHTALGNATVSMAGGGAEHKLISTHEASLWLLFIYGDNK